MQDSQIYARVFVRYRSSIEEAIIAIPNITHPASGLRDEPRKIQFGESPQKFS